MKTVTSEIFTLDVETADCIKSVIAKIKDKHGILINEERLILAGNQLEEGCTLSCSSIPKDAPISNLEFRSIQNMVISVEICNFKIVTIDLEPTNFNENVKTQSKVYIRSYLQSFISINKQLEDGCTTLSH